MSSTALETEKRCVKADPYRELLGEIAPRKVYVCPYPGNSGDELIVRGTLSLLEEMGIETTKDGSRADLLLYPGGNPTMWREDIAVWRDVWKRYPLVPFVVGPATFQAFERHWLEALERNRGVVQALVARDPASFEVLKSQVALRDAKVLLSHDPAFYLRGNSQLKGWLEGVSEEYDLCSFRNDHEGGGSAKQSLNLLGLRLAGGLVGRWASLRRRGVRRRKLEQAAQLIGGFPTVVRDASLMNFDMFLDTIMRARHVHTDRLHVMICACLLNKKVYAYSTSYGKLESVYRHSMQGWADVEFV